MLVAGLADVLALNGEGEGGVWRDVLAGTLRPVRHLGRDRQLALAAHL